MKKLLYPLILLLVLSALIASILRTKSMIGRYLSCTAECESLEARIEKEYSSCISEVKVDVTKLRMCLHAAPENQDDCFRSATEAYTMNLQKCKEERDAKLKQASECRDKCRRILGK